VRADIVPATYRAQRFLVHVAPPDCFALPVRGELRLASEFDAFGGLWRLGAGATVGFSFLLVAALMPARRSRDRRLRLALPSGGTVGRSIVFAVRVASITLFALVVIAGLIGNQSPFKNIAPTMVWVIGWVGLSFASALIGDIWAVINPWDSLARLVERHHQRGNPRRSSSALPSMPWLDAWPAVLLFLLFAWCELIWDGSDQPRSLAWPCWAIPL
jgi:hypothetical protein